MLIYCLDNSDAACRSEDYPCGNRLSWQLAVVRTVSRSLLAPHQGQQLGNTSNAPQQLAVVSSAARPELSVAPTSDAAALLGLDVSRLAGERCQFLSALKLSLLALKRASSGRVLAFLASRVDLPADQCSQLSRSFATARVPLDVVVLCQDDELTPELKSSLELLTAESSYDQPAASSSTAGTAAASCQRPWQRRAAPGSSPPSSALHSSLPQPAAGPLSLLSVASSSTSPASLLSAGTDAAAAGPDAAGPCGQRLMYFPPPDPSMALWQQMEPLLELLQLEGNHQQLGGGGGGGSGGDGDPGTANPEDDPPGAPAHPRTGAGGGSGRPPLPRPPRYRAGGAPAAAAAAAASGSAAAAAAAASTSSGVGISQRPLGLAPSGPLTSRSGARGGAVGTCRYESLDSLQHLSLDGFLRSWLPSYANISRVLQISPAAAAAAAQQQQQQQNQGAGGGGGGGGGPRSEIGLGPGRLCYISVYRLRLPRWHKLCEVHAGCMNLMELPPPGTTEQQGAGSEAEGAAASMVAPSTRSEAAAPALPPPARPAVVVPRAPCPVQVHFSTRCSSTAAAAASASAATDCNTAPGRCQWVCPDLRRGSLSLVASVEDPGVVKLLWSERQRPSAQQQQQQQQYGNIFATPEDTSEAGVEPATAELELTLSPTRSQFRVVPHVKGGAVLEVLYPRSAVRRPRSPSASSSRVGSRSGAPHDTAQGPHSGGSTAAASPLAHSYPSQHQAHHHLAAPSKHHDRYFFWLQQDWEPESATTAMTAAAVVADSVAEEGQAPAAVHAQGYVNGAAEAAKDSSEGAVAPGRVGPVPDRGVRALADHLQALLECPPEFDPHKHICRVRCSSTPLQLGPLPFALVEEIMRASGRQLHPDGTLAVAATSSAISTATTAPAPAPAPAASVSSPPAAPGLTTVAASQPTQQQQQQLIQQSSGGGASGRGGSEQCQTPAASVTLQRDRTGSGPGSGLDGLCSLALSRSPTTFAEGPGVASNATASAPKCLIGKRTQPACTATSTANPAGAPVSGASGDLDTWARFKDDPELRRTGKLARRHAYVPRAASHVPPGCGGAGGPAAAGLVAVDQGLPCLVTRLEAARALSSHPLDDTDWGSDCDSPAAGAPSSSAAATCAKDASPSSGREEGALTGAALEDNIADTAAAAVAERPPAGTAAACLPGSGCPRGGLAAAAAVAAAAAAVGSSGASLVAAVEPEAGGSCPEESSLMFELD